MDSFIGWAVGTGPGELVTTKDGTGTTTKGRYKIGNDEKPDQRYLSLDLNGDGKIDEQDSLSVVDWAAGKGKARRRHARK